MDALHDTLDAFAGCTGIPVTIYDAAGKETGAYLADRKICTLFPHFSRGEACRSFLSFSMQQSFAMGEPYIFFCPAGFVQIAVPLIKSGVLTGYVLAGPLVLGQVDENLLSRIAELNPGEPGIYARTAMFLQKIRENSPEQVQKIATLLYAAVLSSGSSMEDYARIRAHNQSQITTGETVEQFKFAVGTPAETVDTLWQQLLTALHEHSREGADNAASGLFDEFLLAEAGNFDSIRMRLFELYTALSKAALGSGVSLNKILTSGLDPLDDLNRALTLEDLAVWLRKVIDHFFSIAPTASPPSYSPLVEKAVNYIDIHYAEKLTLRDVAGSVHINESYLSKLFKKETGVGFTDYLNNLRIRKSTELLETTDLNLLEIAGRVGFDDQSYFTKVFKKITGKTPKQYKNGVNADKLLDNAYMQGFPVTHGGKEKS